MKRPAWIRGKISWSNSFEEVSGILKELNLNTVCSEAACPNRGECWEKKHATFMILGSTCTRGCLFCNIREGWLEAPDTTEPERIAEAIKKLSIKYAVITSVTRDDLEDKGTGHFVETVRCIKSLCPNVIIELLIPDFGGEINLLKEVAFSGVEVIGHNIEMPQKMYPAVRPRSDYIRSLNVLRNLSDMKQQGADILVKSSLIIGLGEEEGDIVRTLEELKEVDVDIVYIGQYLSPSASHWPVEKYYTPQEFILLEEKALKLGFKAVNAGAMVRSSYRSYETYLAVNMPS